MTDSAETETRSSGVWGTFVAPAALCVVVAAIGFMPQLIFHRASGSLGFISAFDEDSYLLGLPFAPHRGVADAVVGLGDLLTPSTGSLLVVLDVVLPVAVAVAAWAVAARTVKDTGLRLLGALLLIFGQELLSLSSLTVWPGREMADLRGLHPPLTLELLPDATTSYFTVFRSPEPQVSWIVLFAFLAMIAGPDPLAAFDGRRRALTLVILAILPFVYVFVSVPVFCITVALLVWAFFGDRSRFRPVLAAAAISAISFIAVFAATAISGGRLDGGASTIFGSRLPSVTPAVLLGLLAAAVFVSIYRTRVFREAHLFTPLIAVLMPTVLTNQQIVTGLMVSTRDWERYANYALLLFGLLSMIGLLERRYRRDRAHTPLPARAFAWGVVTVLVVQLFAWQRNTYDYWRKSNLTMHATAATLDRLPERLTTKPIVIENAGDVPGVRLLTDDRFEFVLDYTRLFEDPNPSFSDGGESSAVLEANRRRLFEYYFRLGRSPQQVEDQLRTELANPADGGYYSHFAYSLRDVWPPETDWREMHRDEALARLPALIHEYSRYVEQRRADDPTQALVIPTGTSADPGDGRVNKLVTSSNESEPGPTIRIYEQRFP